MSVTFNFANKKVIITGAAGVLGTWIAKAFYKSGADIWLVDQNEGRLKELARALNGKGAVRTASFDLRQEEEIKKYFSTVSNEWGYADFLINNAGIYPSSHLLDLKTDSYDDIMAINVKAPLLMTKHFSKLLIEANEPGSVVNIISKSAKTPRIGAVPYAMSKAALEMMTRGYAMELAEHGIRVNAVSPGFAPGSDTSYLSDEYIQAMRKKIPLGRTSAEEDAPNAIMFLCSDEATFITGASLYVDGGNSAGDFNIPINS